MNILTIQNGQGHASVIHNFEEHAVCHSEVMEEVLSDRRYLSGELRIHIC